jgi:hypothetical protein
VEYSGDVQKELTNRTARKISAEDEELFGLVWIEDVLANYSDQALDSINRNKNISVLKVSKKDSLGDPVINQIFESYQYELDRDQKLSVQSFHNDHVDRPYYYGSKPFFQENKFFGITFLKIDAAEVRRNMPEK